jgi:hypothetical protein
MVCQSCSANAGSKLGIVKVIAKAKRRRATFSQAILYSTRSAIWKMVGGI